MVLPIELGPDPVVYGLSLAGICIFFMKLGLNEWNFPTIVPQSGTQKKFYAPLAITGFWAMQFFTLLLHGAILGGLIVMYQGTLRNSKDNVILVLSTIALGLNLMDFFFKSYLGMYYIDPDSVTEGVLDINAKYKRYGDKAEDEAKTFNMIRKYKWVMFFTQVLGLVAFFTTTFAYTWIGDMADESSNSRSMLTASGIALVAVFGFGLAAMYSQTRLFSGTAAHLLAVSGVKLNLKALPNTTGKPLHGDIHVSGITEALQHDNPDTPLLMAAAAKAAQGVHPGITAENWMVIKSSEGAHLVSPEVFEAHQDLMRATHGHLIDHVLQHSGLSTIDRLAQYADAVKDKIKVLTPYKIGMAVTNFSAYTVFFGDVAGFGRGMGVYFNTHPWLPLLSCFYMFGFYLLVLQQAVAALLALTIAHIPALVMCFFGLTQQWWELFRWNFLVGWSLINLVVYAIPTENARYIRDAASWNITNLPVQEFPNYPSADNSTTVLGYNALGTTMISTVLLGVLVIFFVRVAENGCKCRKIDPKTGEEVPLIEKPALDMAPTNSSMRTLSGVPGLKQRSVRYLVA